MKKNITWIFIFILSCLIIWNCSGYSKKNEDDCPEFRNSLIIVPDPIIIVRKNLNFELNKFNKIWNKHNKQIAIKTLIAGENEFNIDHKLVLSIIALESNFKITAYNKNKNKTHDVGLTQQNSKAINGRYKRAEYILEKYDIKFTKSKFDISKNIMSAFIYLRDIQNEYSFDQKQMIIAYNLGIRGAMLSERYETGEKYYNAVMKYYTEFVN